MKFFVIIKDNSERVPRKNFLDLGGKPLWRHLIDNLNGEEVYIDTDSEVVLQSHKNAYKRLKRHVDLENDTSFAVSPVLLMIERFLDNYVFDDNEIIVTPHVTSPFIKLETIKSASEKLKEGHDSVQACTIHKEFAYFNNNPINFDPRFVPKTQDLQPIILGNGAFFIFTKKSFKENKNRTGKRPYFYPLDYKEAIEIDTWEDFKIAQRFITNENYRCNT